MKELLLLTFMVVYVCGCGHPAYPPVLDRVVAGVDVKPHSWPWQVSLQSDKTGHWNHVCGGTLISSEWVLTAAHCFNGRSNYTVKIGMHSLKASEESLVSCKAAQIITHEDYNMMLSRNDIALVKLSTPVVFSDTMMSSCLPQRNSILPNGMACYITGWGRLSTDGIPADILQQALLPVIDHNTCSQPNWWGVLVTNKMLCAGGDGVAAGCNGDSGGPLNCQNPDASWTVYGVVSFGSGQGCNVFMKPTVFTQVSSYLDWIEKVMSKD
ncbi:chymotrypsin-like elastase family member 2A [Stigmatopora argus]